jgi:mono/diheme cytochrome c family protein
MRRASLLLAPLLLAFTVSGCATPPVEAAVGEPPSLASAAPQRGAELYGRYCTGCHAGAVRTNIARAGAPWLMHIQARVGMGTIPAGISETVTREDARLIVDYLDSTPALRLDD